MRLDNLGLDPDFWRGKKVFLTGHTGFKGTWISLWLHAMGASVTGYSLRPATQPSIYEICRMNEIVSSYIHDIRDYNSLADALLKTEPDIVIHMAAQPLVRESYAEPAATFEINMMGTVHLLEAVRQAVQNGSSISAVVNVTSDKCYDNQEWTWGYREIDPLGGSDPYSGSKAGSEIITNSYRRAFFNPLDSGALKVPIATARAGNVIGGGDWSKDRLVPDSIRAIRNKKPIVIRYPEAIRPWQHVLEPLYGYLLLAQKMTDSGAALSRGWNFGPDYENAVSVQRLVNLLCKEWGDGASFIADPITDHPHEAHYLSLDSSLARQTLGWKPQWNLDVTLSRTIEWYKAYLQKQDMREFSLRQINAYMGGGQTG
ncbi:CDP-glucose 4,6-dehydratase [Paenibacillus vini]|uniref:CDP-glucose 4,6-dehydratase n=1 Tax=Paenibacillus vini TaxID=1476024 RepID=A0ABQ4MGD7_9BACL|nr:CDP-glucose 4,6-dehydratase [Paenibacillus vini]GIP55046.1 CDP-glucose 4,6-dehydratase [Paenibacillus vini]